MTFPCAPPFDAAEARQRCLEFRRRILAVSQGTPLHVAPSFSCLEMVDAAYFGLMRRTAEGKFHDSFILSKGHGAAAQYVVLEKVGLMPSDQLDKMCRPGSCLGTHPDIGTPGVEASTGSLGHGLPLSLGMALADHLHKNDRVTYLVMSDGELQEGSVWEALMLAPSLHLTNLVAMVDLNDQQSLGRTSKTLPNFYPMKAKLEAFGWEVAEVDGHDSQALVDAVKKRNGKAPCIVLGKTIKGYGVSYMQDAPIWHYRSPNPQEYQQALRELSEAAV